MAVGWALGVSVTRADLVAEAVSLVPLAAFVPVPLAVTVQETVTDVSEVTDGLVHTGATAVDEDKLPPVTVHAYTKLSYVPPVVESRRVVVVPSLPLGIALMETDGASAFGIVTDADLVAEAVSVVPLTAFVPVPVAVTVRLMV